MDVIGGGERHIISICEVLRSAGYVIDIAWDDATLPAKLSSFLSMDLSSYTVVPHVFKQGMSSARNKLLKQYDVFIYVTDGSYFPGKAKRNIIFSMYPDKNLYKLFPINWLKLRNYDIVANGDFTAEKIRSWLHKPVHVIYPYVDRAFFAENPIKNRTILSVGRFFKHLHSKRQDVLIHAFTRLQHDFPETRDYTLVLAGGLRQEDQAYMDELEQLSSINKNILFRPNIAFDELKKLYSQAHVYWHAAGYGIDENTQPDLVEHVGISPLEAMASGCITFCYKAGGPARYVSHGSNGFLYSSMDELVELTADVLHDGKKQLDVMKNGQIFVGSHFSYPVFKNKVEQLFSLA